MKKLLIVLSVFLLSFTPSKTKVLFVGDSLTCYTGGWQAQVCKSFGYDFDNISKGGKRTDWMLKVLTQQLKNHTYDKVFIYGGANDAYSYVSLDGAIKNIQAMVDLCHQYKAEPIVVVGYDPLLVQTKTVYSEKVTAFHRGRYVELQTKMVKELKRCRIISKDTTVTKKDSGDGIHLDASGHRKFANWVIKELKTK